MIIERFGATYNAAYVFSRAGEVDTWSITRPPQAARVGALPGAFDFYGDTNYPYASITARKSMLVTGATYAAVQTAIDALKAATIDLGVESRLWLLLRDGATQYLKAKCVSLKISDQAGQIYFIRAEVEFFSRDAIAHFT